MRALFLFFMINLISEGFSQDLFETIPNDNITPSGKIFSRVVSPQTNSASIDFEGIHVCWAVIHLGSSSDEANLYIYLKNKTKNEFYIDFGRAKAVIGNITYNLYYMNHYNDIYLQTSSVPVLPNTSSPQLFLYTDDIPLVYSGRLRILAKQHGIGTEKSKQSVRLILPIVFNITGVKRTLEIDFEFMWVDRRFIKHNDYFRLNKWSYFPRNAYETLQKQSLD